MSGDVQPRRRKDKKRKRDDRKSEGEVNLSRQQSFQDDDESSHGVQSTHMGIDDQHIHVHHEPHTGGHWCAKTLFFILMTVMLGLVGMIILETRGLSDLDTPLSESRYSNYLHGWVEEHREEHDDHDKLAVSAEEHDEPDEHDEAPLEEEEDHSETEEEEEEENDNEEEEKEGLDKDNDVDSGNEDNQLRVEDEDINENEDLDDEEDDEEDNEEGEDDDDDVEGENADDDVVDESENESEDYHKIDDDDDDDNEDPINVSKEIGDEDDDEEGNDKLIQNTEGNTESNPKISSTYDDEDDDGFESFEEEDEAFLENDAEEILILKAKENANRLAKENEEGDEEEVENENDKKPDKSTSYLNKLAINIGVGVALALVARFVLVQKKPKTNDEKEQPTQTSAETIMKRRVTITSPEDTFLEDKEKNATSSDNVPISDEELNLEEEEEIEYIEEEEIIELETEDGEEEDEKDKELKKQYVPTTFEEFNAMYRPKNSTVSEQAKNSAAEETIKAEQDITELHLENSLKKKPNAIFKEPPPPAPRSSSTAYERRNFNNTFADIVPQSPAASSSSTLSSYQVKSSPKAKVTFSPTDEGEQARAVSPTSVAARIRKREFATDVDYFPDDGENDCYNYSENDYDGDEEAVGYEENDAVGGDDDMEEGDEDLLNDDGSDIDDSELMNRLEAKYGRLPEKEYESDEDPDDPTWTQIKEKPVDGGPLAQDEEGYSYFMHGKDRRPLDIFDDMVYENEMNRANDELLRQHHGRALIIYAELSKKFPDRAAPFLGQARIYEELAKKHNKMHFAEKSINAYQRYLSFNELIGNDREFKKSAETCVELMRSLGYFNSAFHIHRILVDRFPKDPNQRNNLAITLLMMERYSDAKVWLKDSLKEWPHNGLTLTLFGYTLKMHDADYVQAANYLQRGLDSQVKEAQDARFYLALGESYERLGLTTNASSVYKLGAQLKLFPSPHQRSVYNQPNLRAKAIWSLAETTHEPYFRMISDHWRTIRDEALHVLANDGGSDGYNQIYNEVYFHNETEHLLATGNWKELLLFSRGERHIRNCQRTPTTCLLVEQFKPAAACRRGQVKFSIMQPGTHIWPHCGPTNSRLRAHLGLVVPQKARMRVVNETISWTEGEFIVFDDSFEHEVWHEGEKLRLILIVDFWHPDLTEQQTSMLTKI